VSRRSTRSVDKVRLSGSRRIMITRAEVRGRISRHRNTLACREHKGCCGLEPASCLGPGSIRWIEQRTGLVLAQSQRSALALALTSKALVITGGPRVGCGSDACEGDAQGRLGASGRGLAMGTTAQP
jgi:hypothetical protein